MTALGRRIVGLTLITMACAHLPACQMGVTGNDQGSEPINADEEKDYKKAIVRCYKTGGTRVVKIMGELRCY